MRNKSGVVINRERSEEYQKRKCKRKRRGVNLVEKLKTGLSNENRNLKKIKSKCPSMSFKVK